MKKIAFLPLSATLAFLCIGKSFAEDLNLLFEKSKISVTRLGSVSQNDPEIKVAIYSTEYFKPQRSDDFSCSKNIEILALNCPKSKFITLNLTYLDALGNQVRTVNFVDDFQQNKWVIARPKSIAKRMLDFACKQSTEDKMPSTNKPHAVDDAYKVCQAFMGIKLTTECEVSRSNSSIDIRIDMNGEEARETCDGAVKLIRDKTSSLNGAWKLRLFSPHSGDNPLATCVF